MAKISFQDTVKNFLATEYKPQQGELKCLPKGQYNYRGTIYYYDHILPADKWLLNITPDYRKVIEQIINGNYHALPNQKKIARHSCFSHLNSSQAMCLNFFAPLIIEKKLDLLQNLLGLDQNESFITDHSAFEKEGTDKYTGDDLKKLARRDIKVSANDNKPTNFDFFLETKSEKKFYFEIKFTEDGFAGNKKNASEQKYRDKYDMIYAPLLCDRQNNIINLANQHKGEQQRNEFYGNYQIFRNLLAIKDKKSYVVFVYPKQNERIRQQAETAKKFLTESYQSHLILLEWDVLFDSIKRRVRSGELYEHLKKFGEKYIEALGR